MPIRRAAALLASLVFAFAVPTLGADAQDVDLQWGVKIPLRDGIELAATVYRPQSDQLLLWLTNRYHPWLYRPGEVAGAARDGEVLEP